MQIIAMLTRSAGNAEVGSMWTETKIFKPEDKIEDVIEWAVAKSNCTGDSIKERLTLQIAQEAQE